MRGQGGMWGGMWGARSEDKLDVQPRPAWGRTAFLPGTVSNTKVFKGIDKWGKSSCKMLKEKNSFIRGNKTGL